MLGSHYREQLEKIFTDGVASGDVRDSVDCHFIAQSVISICNGFGDIIVRDPNVDVFDIARKCTDLLLHGTGPNQP